MVALSDDEATVLEHTLEELNEAGVRGELWSPRQVHSAEPLVTEQCVAGLWMPDEGVIDPMALTVFDRQQPTAYLTDSHASNFTSNILTLLLEARLGLALFNPLGVCKTTFNGTS